MIHRLISMPLDESYCVVEQIALRVKKKLLWRRCTSGAGIQLCTSTSTSTEGRPHGGSGTPGLGTCTNIL